MEENIIGMIEKTEQRAAEIREQAKERALAIVTEAEKRAMEIAKSSEGECAALREEIVRRASKDAEEAYLETIARCRASAASYADELLRHVEPQVAAIVGRIVK